MGSNNVKTSYFENALYFKFSLDECLIQKVYVLHWAAFVQNKAK